MIINFGGKVVVKEIDYSDGKRQETTIELFPDGTAKKRFLLLTSSLQGVVATSSYETTAVNRDAIQEMQTTMIRLLRSITSVPTSTEEERRRHATTCHVEPDDLNFIDVPKLIQKYGPLKRPPAPAPGLV